MCFSKKKVFCWKFLIIFNKNIFTLSINSNIKDENSSNNLVKIVIVIYLWKIKYNLNENWIELSFLVLLEKVNELFFLINEFTIKKINLQFNLFIYFNSSKKTLPEIKILMDFS